MGPAELIAAAAEAGVFHGMTPEERSEWLRERGWTSPAYLEALLVNRRAWSAGAADDDPDVLPEPLTSPDYVEEEAGPRWSSHRAWRLGLRAWIDGDRSAWREGWK